MKLILISTFLVIIVLFGVGYGYSSLLTPKKLRNLLFWLSPWYAVFLISLLFTVLSLGDFPVAPLATPFTFLSVLLSLRKAYTNWKIHPFRILKRDLALSALVGITLIFNLLPLLKTQRLLTTVSLGNNDALVYASVPEYLRENTIFDARLSGMNAVYDYKGIYNLLNTGYRWGTPILSSYLLTLLKLEGYQLAYLLQAILFSLMLPLVYILFTVFFPKKSGIYALFSSAIVGFNAHLLYMLYHNFAGQIFFWGASTFYLIFFLLLTQSFKKSPKTRTQIELILGVVLSSLYVSYHEGAVFLTGPTVIIMLLLFLIKKSRAPLRSLGTIFLTMLILSAVSVAHGVKFDLEQSKLVGGFIGWQVFRDKIPFANPFEMFGFRSIHSFPPLGRYSAFILSALTLITLFVGVRKSRRFISLSGFLFVYAIFISWTYFVHHNFFAYNRVITYILPSLTPLLVGGISFLKSKYYPRRVLIILLAMGIYSGTTLSLLFSRQHIVVDRGLISLKDLSSQRVEEPIYLSDVITKEGYYWYQIWTEYFLYPSKTIVTPLNIHLFSQDSTVPNNPLILAPKSPWLPGSDLSFSRIIWENGFYTLGYLK